MADGDAEALLLLEPPVSVGMSAAAVVAQAVAARTAAMVEQASITRPWGEAMPYWTTEYAREPTTVLQFPASFRWWRIDCKDDVKTLSGFGLVADRMEPIAAFRSQIVTTADGAEPIGRLTQGGTVSTPTPPYEPLTYERQVQYANHEQGSKKQRRRRGGAGIIVGAGVVALIAGAAGGAVGYTAAKSQAPGLTIASSTAGSTSVAAAGSIAAVAAAVQPAVVQLNVGNGESGGTGSGFVISDDGYIVTNNHVTGAGGEIEVTFSDGRTATGKLVGANPGYDIAVVKVDRTGLATVPLGESAALLVGDTVIAVGSPLGLQGTVTTGIVSALNRPVTAGGEGETAFINAIQTDAAINPGNSGGPLVNGAGAVIGVNSAIASMATGAGQPGSIGLGFAIPIDVVKRITNELIKTGTSKTPIVGVQLNMTFEGPGAKVAEVTAGGPAAAAGLRVDDIVTKVNGSLITDPTSMIVTVRSFAPGDTVELTVTRDGEAFTVPVTLEASKAKE